MKAVCSRLYGRALPRATWELASLGLLVWAVLLAHPRDVEAVASREPEVLSLFPLGGSAASVIEAEVLGKSLEGAYTVWSNREGVTGEVRAVEDTELVEFKKGLMDGGSKKTKANRAVLTLKVAAATPPGISLIRLLTPGGVSNALPFLVLAPQEPSVDEIHGPHDSPSQAQRITIPAVVHGKVSKSGEVDFYEIEAGKDQELVAEMITKPVTAPSSVSAGFSTALALFEPTGSWFSEHQLNRLAYSDESVAGAVPTHSVLRHKIPKQGRYLLRATSLSSKGGPEFSYQLRIALTGRPSLFDRLRESQSQGGNDPWQERDFTRRLEPDRLKQLWGRSLRSGHGQVDRKPDAPLKIKEISDHLSNSESAVSKDEEALAPVLLRDEEPNDSPQGVKKIQLPAIIEGSIAHPGDTDSFKFQVEKGDAVAFEIETPATAPPLFNPKLAVLDETGREFLGNVFRRIARNFTFYAKTIQPKTVFTFELGGEYTLQIRDIASRVGDPGCQYRVLVRRQIPHIGEIETNVDRLNVSRGSSRKLNVTTGQEEGYAGDVAITLEGLPEGVTAVPGTEVKPDRGTNPDEGPRERFLAKAETATILLAAGADAPLTAIPRTITVVARPVVDGIVGPPLRSREVLLMVVQERRAGGKEEKETH